MTSNLVSIPNLFFALAFKNWKLPNLPNSLPICDDEMLDTICILKMYRTQMKPFIHSRNRKAFYKSLTKAERRLRSRKIPRCALLHPTESAWSKLFEAKNDQAMITATGLSCDAFNALNDKFKQIFNDNTPHTKDGLIFSKGSEKRGRKRLVGSETGLGLVLMWTRTRGSGFS